MTQYCVKYTINGIVAGPLRIARFDSATERAMFIISMSPYVTIEEEWEEAA